jgi:C4-dicarboxylate-specific signal transduction histidine kinase
VYSSRDANRAANELAKRISQFVPSEDRASLLRDHHGLKIYNAIQPALAYILVELVDNVFNHARTEEYRNPVAWMVVQYYRSGDLVRIAVVDDGCGFLGSMRGMMQNAPRSHSEAVDLAFMPFVSSKNLPAIYAERRHMGIGLPVCRDICQRMDGQVYAATGDSWISNPGLQAERRRRAEPFYQGTIVSLEFHRRAATVNTLRDILSSYSGSEDLPIQFHND